MKRRFPAFLFALVFLGAAACRARGRTAPTPPPSGSIDRPGPTPSPRLPRPGSPTPWRQPLPD